MRRSSLGEVAAGMALRAVLGRLTREPAAPVRRSRRAAARRTPSPPAPPPQPVAPAEGAVRRRPLTVLMVACLVIGVPLMVLFENAVTRIAGMGCLFAFIISGVFLIADPSALGRIEE